MRIPVHFLIIACLPLLFSCNREPEVTADPQASWKDVLKEDLHLLGHRNWILVVDKAFPEQSSAGIKYIYVEDGLLPTLEHVLDEVESSTHVKPIIYRDRELSFIAEEQVDGIDELHLAASFRAFAVRDNPHIGGNARVVEELVGHGDDGIEPIVLDNPTADFTFARTRVTGEQRRTVEDNGQPRSALVGGRHLGNHVLKEQERTVVDTGEPGAEATVVSLGLMFLANRVFVRFPLNAERRIGQHVVIRLALGTVLGKTAAEDDMVDVVANMRGEIEERKGKEEL